MAAETDRAALTTAAINNLPDSAFAYIEPGGKKDASGKTIPRSKRHFPLHDKAHVQNALSRAPQSPFGAKAMPAIKAAARKYGIAMSQSNSAPLAGESRDDMGNVASAAAGGLDAVARQYCAAQGWALPDGTFPVRPLNWHGADDLDAAIAEVTAGNAYHDGARRHIMRRAAAIGLAGNVPASWGNAGNDTDDTNSAAPGGEYRTVALADPLEVREGRDGLTFEGYAAVFNAPARIRDIDGDFDEQIAPGAFRSVVEGKYPALMFEHGRHPLIGTMPLGRITNAREDAKGLHITARLTDNWLIQPVRDAVRDQAVKGMSFRFPPPGDDGQRWEKRSGDVDLRTLLRLDPPELGPVVFPAYEPTTASVRSALDRFPPDFTGRAAARSGAGGEHEDVQPGNGGPSPNPRTVLRDRAWRMRRQLHG